MVIRDARRDDVPLLLEMFAELADYEHLGAIFRATEVRLEQALFSERAVAEALIAERGGEAAGYAVYFPTFSSFLASPGIWLEDLFVRPPHRRFGVGRALLSALTAALARAVSAWNGRRWTGTSWRWASTAASARAPW